MFAPYCYIAFPRAACMVLFALISISFSAQVIVSGHCELQSMVAGTKLILEYWQEDGWKQHESASINAQHAFQFSQPIQQSGQFRIKVAGNPQQYAHFAIHPRLSKDTLTLSLNDSNLNGAPLPISNSEESIAYCRLLSEADKFWKLRDSLKYTHSQSIRAEIHLSNIAAEIQKTYPQTYTAQYICPLLVLRSKDDILSLPADSQITHISKTRFANSMWNHSLFLRNSVLIRQLNYHYYYFNDHKIPEQYIDGTMKHGLNNDTVQAFLFRFILDKMVDYKSEEGLSYLITWYASDCTENNVLPDATKNLLLALEKCKPGQKIENLVLPDKNGNRISLEQTYKNAELTLIMFWRTNCTHCREFEPELDEIYKKYHPKGLQVYAINADKEEETWKKFIQNSNYSWPSVFLAYDSRKDFSKRFPVPSTPTLIAVDKNGVIVKRLIMRSKLEDDLQYILK